MSFNISNVSGINFNQTSQIQEITSQDILIDQNEFIQNFSNTLQNINDNEFFSIQKYINNDFVKNEYNLELLYLINKNNIENFNEDKIDKLLNLKNEILDKTFDETEICFHKILQINNNTEYIADTLISKTKNLENLNNKFIMLFNQRNININLLKFSNILYDTFIENKSSKFNFNINNYYFKNKNIINKNIINKKNKQFIVKNEIKLNNTNNIGYELFTYLTNIKLENKEKIKKNDETGLITQVFINTTKLLFSMNENILFNKDLRNYDITLNNKINNLNSYYNFKLFDYVIFDDKNLEFDVNVSLLTQNDIESNLFLTSENSNEFDTINLDNNDNFSKKSKIQKERNQKYEELINDYLSNELKQISGYEKQLLINKFKFYKQSINSLNRDFLYKQRYASEINKLYCGDVFNANIKKHDIFLLQGLDASSVNSEFSYDNFINNNDTFLSGGNRNNEIKINLGIESTNKNYNIYFNRKNIFNKNSNYTTSESNIITENKNKISINSEFKNFINNPVSINDTEYSLMLDKFIKKAKLKNIKNLDINIDIFKEIYDNIKNCKNKNMILSYIHEDNENIALCNEKNKLFNVLFTKKDDDFYSNFSLNTNEKIFDKNYYSLELNKEINKTFYDEKNNIKTFFSNYISNNNFISSSNYLKNMISTISNDLEKIDNIDNIDDIIKTNELYFNYLFDKNCKNTTRRLIIKRFIKKAITRSKNTSIFLKNNLLKEFSYDIEKFKEEDYEKTSKKSIEKYLLDILSTSESLNDLSENVFSLEMIKKISNKYKFDMSKLIDYDYTISQDDESSKLNILIASQIFPFVNAINVFKSKNDFNKINDKLTSIIDILNKNRITLKILQDDTNEYNIDKSRLDITNKKHIYKQILTNANNSDNAPFTCIIEDKFDESCEKTGSIFKNICDSIIELLNFTNFDFIKKQFNSEKEIDDFINKNEYLYEYVNNLLYLYKPFNDYINKKIITYSVFKSFEKLNQVNKNNIITEFNRNQIGVDFYIQYITKNNIIKNIENLFNDNNNNNLNFAFADDLFNEFKTLNIELNNDNAFNKKYSIEIFENNTSFYNVFYSIYKKLYLSDLSLIMNFDIINSSFDITSDIIDNSEKFLSQNLIDISQQIGFNINHINNTFYINNFLKKVQNVIIYNNEIKNNIINNIENNNNDYILTNNLFNEIKNIEKYKKPNRINELLKSDLYGVYIDAEFLQKKSYDSKIIKISIQSKDMSNLNKIYLPKTLLFSTNISDIDISINKYPVFCGLNNENKKYYLYFNNLNSNIDNILHYMNIDDLKANNNDQNPIILNIKKHINDIEQEEIDKIYNHILNCHSDSSDVCDILYLLNDINFNNINQIISDNNTTDNIVNNLTNLQLKEIFGNEINDNMILEKTKENINNLLSSNTDISFIQQNDFYDIFHLNYSIESQPFLLMNDDDKDNYNIYTLNDTEKLLYKYFEKINLNIATPVYIENSNIFNNNIINNITMELI